MLDFIVSVCHPKHLAAWREAQKRLPEFVPTRDHLLVVPDECVEDFVAVTDRRIRIEPESAHTAQYSRRLRNELQRMSQERRFGSYVQQMIKLGALRGRPDGQRLLIWDADTVPLRELEFFTEAGHVRCYAQHGAHEPMFVQIERLLGLQKATKRSFIAQCLPIRSEWANAFFEYLEGDGVSWHDRLLSSIPFNRGSALSEYELLGTFSAHYFESQIVWSDEPWVRNGYRYALLESDSLDLSEVPQTAHFVALEDYDRPGSDSGDSSVDPSFEPVSARNRRIADSLAESFSRLLLADASRQMAPKVLFVGLHREGSRLLPVGDLTARDISIEAVSPFIQRTTNDADDWVRLIHGIPGERAGEGLIYYLDVDSVNAPDRFPHLIEEHVSGGLIVSPRRTHLSCRFWTELVDWDEPDSTRRSQLDEVRPMTVPVVAWSELLQGRPSAVLISLLGFEDEVLGSFVTALESHSGPAPVRVGFVSTFKHSEVITRLEMLGYARTLQSTQPDGAEPVLWGFQRLETIEDRIG